MLVIQPKVLLIGNSLQCQKCKRVWFPPIGWIHCDLVLGYLDQDICGDCLLEIFLRQFKSQQLTEKETNYDESRYGKVHKPKVPEL